MLSVFPILLSYSFGVSLVFRVAIGAIFLFSGYKNLSEKKSNSSVVAIEFKNVTKEWLWAITITEVLGALLLIAGLFTQIASIALSIIILASIIRTHKKTEAFSSEQSFLILLLLITLSLLFLGPGFYSFDLPI